MSEEMKLPDELAAYEAQLAALPLAAPQIDRDALMYQAGYAAAVTSPPSKVAEGPWRRGARGGIPWRNNLSLAALAASVAIAATLALTQPNQPPSVTSPSSVTLSHSDIREVESDPSADLVVTAFNPPSRVASLPQLAILDPDRNVWPSPLTIRQRLTSHFVAATAASDEPAAPAEPTTVRRLLNDLAPRDDADSQPTPNSVWPWSTFLGDRTI